jgi:hypothetical protein
MLMLKDSSGNVIDQMNWGTADTSWNNYDSGVWSDGFSAAGSGSIKGRLNNGYDTDSANDWIAYGLPQTHLTYPNGGEIWIVGNTYDITWTATNSSGTTVSGYGIDLYYSKDSGSTWASIVKGTENDGTYSWRLPLYLGEGSEKYFSNGKHARIKVVATDYAKNFMISNFDTSDSDFCPPVDKSLLTEEEKQVLSAMDTTGIDFVNNGAAVAETSGTTGTAGSTETETKTTEVLNKDNKDYLLTDQKQEEGSDKDDCGGDCGETGKTSSATEPTATESTANAVAPATTNEGGTTETTESVENSETQEQVSVIAPDTDVTIEFNLNA